MSSAGDRLWLEIEWLFGARRRTDEYDLGLDVDGSAETLVAQTQQPLSRLDNT